MSKEEKLHKVLQDIAKTEDYAANIKIKPISSGGANYTTDLYLVTITDPSKPDLNLFAKVSNLDEATRSKNPFLAKVYLTESLFYTELVSNFERLYNKYNVAAEDRLVIPKYYSHVLVPYEETLVLEDLEARDFENFDRMKTFDWEYASTAVTQLARYNALGLAFRKENPEEFDKIVSNFDLDFTENMDMMNEMLQLTIQNVCEGINDELKQRLQNYFATKDVMSLMSELMTKSKSLLIHGDFRPSNLMHRRRNGKLEIIPLDYQMLRLGTPMLDLMQFIFSGSDAEFRRLHYEELNDHYYKELTLALKNFNMDVEDVYPRKTFDDDLIEYLPYGLCLSLTLIGFITVAPEEAPQLDADLFIMKIKPNQLAFERLTGIIEDFIRWGEL